MKYTRKPDAVLVQLKAETRRTEALIKAKKYNELDILKKDALGAMTATVRDFSDNFSLCPVFYFFDSSTEKVLDKKFDGALLNSDLSRATTIPLTDTSSNYLIVYYGNPSWQTNRRQWDTTRDANWGGDPNGRGLVVNDPMLRQVSYVYRLDFDFFNFRRKGKKNPYKYTSKKFNIEYYPTAAEFQRMLLHRIGSDY